MIPALAPHVQREDTPAPLSSTAWATTRDQATDALQRAATIERLAFYRDLLLAVEAGRPVAHLLEREEKRRATRTR